MKALGFRLHHVGWAVRELDEKVQEYVERYGYECSTPAIHDPLQTAKVQFLKLEGDSSYLEFVAPDGPESKLMGAVKKGGGLNHLCFICGPMEEAIAALEEQGMRLIAEPKVGVALKSRRICWLIGGDGVPMELVERERPGDTCEPGLKELSGT